jgi:hypothetical protein
LASNTKMREGNTRSSLGFFFFDLIVGSIGVAVPSPRILHSWRRRVLGSHLAHPRVLGRWREDFGEEEPSARLGDREREGFEEESNGSGV